MNFVYPLLVILLAVFAVAPLEYPGAFQSHTGLLAVYNLIQLDQNPLQFYLSLPTIGRTVDLLRADGLLPYLVAELVHLVGLNYLDSIKLVYALAWVGSGLSMYSLSRRYLSESASLLAATVYVYLPFHIASVYVRGAFGEASAWAIFPLALAAVLSPDLGNPIRVSWKGALFFLVLFLCQPGIAILFGIVCLGLAIVQNRFSRPGILATILTILSGLVLGLVINLPAILSNSDILAQNGFSPHFILPFQLFSSTWGNGVSQQYYMPAFVSNQAHPTDSFPFQLGVVPISLAIVALVEAFRNREARVDVLPTRQIVIVFTCAAVVLTFFLLDISGPAWRVLGSLASYPWQLLPFVGLALALIGGGIIDLDSRFRQPAMLAFFVALPVVSSYGYLTPHYLDMSPSRPLIATFENNEVALLDYRIVGPLRHGATLRLQLQWQALRQVNHDYTVFVHAVNENGETYGSEDSRPVDGTLPTLKWTPGQVISDMHTIQINVDGPSEGYHLQVGLYQAGTGRRALIDSGAEFLVLPRPGDPDPIISDQLPITSTR